jgi:hypothetical protein
VYRADAATGVAAPKVEARRQAAAQQSCSGFCLSQRAGAAGGWAWQNKFAIGGAVLAAGAIACVASSFGICAAAAAPVVVAEFVGADGTAAVLGEVTSSGDEAAAAATDAADTSLSLTYKVGWSAEQLAAADAKVASLNNAAEQGQLQVTQVERAGTSAASMWRTAGGEVPTNADIDHTIDLQLGGSNSLDNLSPLDYSVNRSLGAQIAWRIAGMAAGTTINGVSIG